MGFDGYAENKRCFNTQPPEGGWIIKKSVYKKSRLFQHTAARRRLGFICRAFQTVESGFNTQPPEGGWLIAFGGFLNLSLFQHTAARRRLGSINFSDFCFTRVSTHSRPKAAGFHKFQRFLLYASFNTQPPEGGWKAWMMLFIQNFSFNTQPPEGGWFIPITKLDRPHIVSTHSRPKAAGLSNWETYRLLSCFNTQPPEGGWQSKIRDEKCPSCFNTQPPEGGWITNPVRRTHEH